MIRLKPITQEQLDTINPFNKTIMAAFLKDSTELSPTTRNSYESSLKVWFVYVKDYVENKRHVDIKPLEYKRFVNWCMAERGGSSSDTNSKRSALASLNAYIETYFSDEHPNFRSFITRNIKRPPTVFIHEKKPLNKSCK